MPILITRRWGGAKSKRVTNLTVFQRYAQLKGISPKTAANYYDGQGPLLQLLGMASVAGQFDRADMVEGWVAKIRSAATVTEPLTSEMISRTQVADLKEDLLEEAFRANPGRETWSPLRKAKLLSLAMEQKLIAAGDKEYC